MAEPQGMLSRLAPFLLGGGAGLLASRGQIEGLGPGLLQGGELAQQQLLNKMRLEQAEREKIEQAQKDELFARQKQQFGLQDKLLGGLSPELQALAGAAGPDKYAGAVIEEMTRKSDPLSYAGKLAYDLAKGHISLSTHNAALKKQTYIAPPDPDNLRAGIPAGMERKPGGSLGWMPGFLEAQGQAQDQRLSKKIFTYPDGTQYRIHQETGARVPVGADGVPAGGDGPPETTSEPFDYGEGGGVLSVLSDVVNRSAGQFVDLGDRDVEKARAKLGMLRVVLPAALRDSARPLKMSEKRMQALLGGDVLESSQNRIALFNQVRESLTAEYKDNQELIADVRITKAKKSDLITKQKKIAEVLNLIGPQPTSSSGISPEDEALMNKYLGN